MRDPLSWRFAALLLVLILFGSFVLKLVNLGHTSLRGLDESFHAIVARNLLKHPFVPTYIDRPFLPRDEMYWQASRVWLHKPILPLWQIALSYLAFGVNTFALRLPSALLSTAAIWLTYAIGRELVDRTTGLIAALLQAISPAILMLVHGYTFSDHVDVSLLFWTELAMWLIARTMRTGSMLTATLAGVAQGLAFLSKTYPALIATGVALVMWLVPQLLDRSDQSRLRARHLLAMLIATIVTAAPWFIYICICFPRQAAAENLTILSHLTRDIESWGAPWDRALLGYLLNALYLFYTTAFVAAAVIAIAARRQRDVRLIALLGWFVGVLVPFTLATSKTPSATLLAWPAGFLLVGAMISRVLRGGERATWIGVAWLATVGLAIFLRGEIQTKAMGSSSPPAWREHFWAVWHILAALALGALAAFALTKLPDGERRTVFRTVVALAAAGTLWLAAETAQAAWKVTQFTLRPSALLSLGEYVQTGLGPNAVLLLDENEKLERNTLMFWSDRTTYSMPTSPTELAARAEEIIRNGGEVYVVTNRPPMRLPSIAAFRSTHRDQVDERHLWGWSANQ
jgi:4-amino-4-deoxy-L-arabinose transferase